MSAHDRYLRAAHAMQSGVAMLMNYQPEETTPKHLRVGVNTSLSDQAALAHLLMRKGVLTEAEYLEAIADQMQKEADDYADRLSEIVGTRVTLA